MIEHASGCTDDDIDATREGANLSIDRLAAERSADVDIDFQRQLLKLADNLLGKLAGRRQDDRLGTPASGFEHLDDWNAESRSLSCPRLGLTDHIETVERQGNKCCLNGTGFEIANPL